jgi:uncharacterized protein (TIGR00369 family)
LPNNFSHKKSISNLMDLNQLHKYRNLAVAGKWAEVESMFNRSIQVQQLGARIDLANPEQPKAIIDALQPHHGGGIGSDAVNGGVLAAMADLALGLLGLTYYKEGMTATAQLTVHYLKPFRSKGLIAEARVQQVVGNRIFGTVELTNDKGEVCTIAYGALAKAISM